MIYLLTEARATQSGQAPPSYEHLSVRVLATPILC